jgi:hypothetical protein
MSDDDIFSAWTDRLLTLAPGLPPEQARLYVHDLYFAAQRDLDRGQTEADFERDE